MDMFETVTRTKRIGLRGLADRYAGDLDTVVGPTRAARLRKVFGISAIEDLAGVGKPALLLAPGLGKRTIESIQVALQHRGLSL